MLGTHRAAMTQNVEISRVLLSDKRSRRVCSPHVLVEDASALYVTGFTKTVIAWPTTTKYEPQVTIFPDLSCWLFT
jgi:hypothetical protein